MAKDELRSLDQILSIADNGEYLQTLMTEHDELLQEMADFSATFGAKAKGSFTLKINYERDRHGQVEMEIDHKIVAPKPPKAKAIAWAQQGGGLSVHNPAQARMEIRDASTGRELRASSFAND